MERRFKINCETESLKNYKIIVVPHEMSQVNLYEGLKESILFSEASSNNVSDYHILIIDKIGILSKIYRYTQLYIGGFGKGIHNTRRRCLQHTCVIGPNYYKFRELKIL